MEVDGQGRLPYKEMLTLSVMTHTGSPSIWETEAGGLLQVSSPEYCLSYNWIIHPEFKIQTRLGLPECDIVAKNEKWKTKQTLCNLHGSLARCRGEKGHAGR